MSPCELHDAHLPFEELLITYLSNSRDTELNGLTSGSNVTIMRFIILDSFCELV